MIDYISVRWTPHTYATHREDIEKDMLEERIQSACLDWAGGWTSRKP
jgi:hypothetical protein